MSEQASGFQLTKELVKSWSPWTDGWRWYLDKFPQGGDYCAVQSALRADKRFDDVRWLADRAFSHAMKEPAVVMEITKGHKAESDALISEMAAISVDVESGDAAQIGSSGYAAQIGSSGDAAQIGSSGNDAQIGSSGNDARIGSSGDADRIGSSGNDAQIGSSGNAAQINAEGCRPVIACAGIGARVRSGPGGAVALAYHDGSRTRFAVGYVGEDLKALTWYEVGHAGQFVEIQQ